MNLEGFHVVLRVASAADAPLKVARHARPFVEYWPETVAGGQRIARCPIVLEQRQTSLDDPRLPVGALTTGTPGVRNQTSQQARRADNPRPTRRRVCANPLRFMVKPPREIGTAVGGRCRGESDKAFPLTIIRYRTIVERAPSSFKRYLGDLRPNRRAVRMVARRIDGSQTARKPLCLRRRSLLPK